MSLIEDAYKDIAKAREMLGRPGVVLSNYQKDKLKKLNDMEKHHPSTNSFNLSNFSSSELHCMIQNDTMPSNLSANQRDRIKELYKSGHTFDAIRKLKGLIEDTKPGKTTL